MRLNLGCGSRLLPGHVNVDIAETADTVLVWDLDAKPWPWDDSTVKSIEAKDIFEHVADAVTFMTECHRVLEPGGTLHIRTPNVFAGPADAFTDPTHRRFPTPHTFDYWLPGTVLYEASNAAYGGVSFTGVRLVPDDGGALDVTLRKPA